MNPTEPLKKPLVWTIAGSDSGGGAGIQADLACFQRLGVYGCSVLTAVTAQNSHEVTQITHVAADSVTAQIQALATDLLPRAIKIGLLGHVDLCPPLRTFLAGYTGQVVLDPVMVSTSGHDLSTHMTAQDFITLFPDVDLITPNITEAQHLLNRPLHTTKDIEEGAKALHHLGAKAVLIKGGHGNNPNEAWDCYCTGQEVIWLSTPRINTPHTHGSGCTLSSAIAACLALGYPLLDALVIAKAYVTQGIRWSQPYGKGPGPVAQLEWPKHPEDFPHLHRGPAQSPFPPCGPLGFYPIVPSSTWVHRLLDLGVRTLQLRIKTPDATIEQQIKDSIAYARKKNARLFINDHWRLAIKHQAYGVHLGQEDLHTADLSAIHAAGLRLGLSTHCPSEVATALAIKPSYIACGPMYPTTCKSMRFAPQGVDGIRYWQNVLGTQYPLVAIGGITPERLQAVLSTGVSGVAVISAITEAADPDTAVRLFLSHFRDPSTRYARQICLPEVGIRGQQRLQQTRVLCIGAGGLGAPVLFYLAAAGIGTLGIVDDDRIEEHNLHRQILYQTQDCGQFKVAVAQQRLTALNPGIRIIPHRTRVTATNIHQLIKDYDLIVDGVDNLPTRYLINDACFAQKKPWITGSVSQHLGQVLHFNPPSGPCYRCLFPESSQPGLPDCQTGGILGPTVGIIGSIQAGQVLRAALNMEQSLKGTLLHCDLNRLKSQHLQLTRQPDCWVCAPPKEAPLDPNTTFQEVCSLRASVPNTVLLDVRNPKEREALHMGGYFIPLPLLSEQVQLLPPKALIIVYCQHGHRSQRAAHWLTEQGFQARSLIGGIAALSQEDIEAIRE